MPYKLSKKGKSIVKDKKIFTELQIDALDFFKDHDEGNKWFHARDVALHYGYPNGQYFRGVLASLHKRGLLIKKE